MQTVMITGGSGFIGSYLVESLLKRGVEVRCLVRSTSAADNLVQPGVTLVQGDLSEPATLTGALDGIDTVFHVAGIMRAFSLKEFMRVNAVGTRNLVSACASRQSPPLMVLVSSVAAAGPAINGRPRHETDDCQPVSNYGRSKRGGELAAAEFAGRLPLTIIRPPMVFGGRDRAALRLFRPISRYGIHPVTGARHRRCISLIHAADLVDGILLAAEHGSRVDVEDASRNNFRQGCYFVSMDQHLRYSQLGDLIGKALGRRRIFKQPSPDTITKLVGAVSGGIGRLRGQPSALSLDKAREAAAGSWTCSPQRIKKELGFNVAATLDDRMRETVDWYRAHHWL